MKREAFMARVRGALRRSEGAPAEAPPPLLLPLTDWDGAALAQQFCAEHRAVGGEVHQVATLAEARSTLKGLLKTAESFICTSDAIIEEVLSAVTLPLAADPALADVGLSGVRYALANTGSLVLTSEVGRRASLLPMTHIALVRTEQIVPSMAEALEQHLSKNELPSAWVQATGPSRTADIELTLTTGVHGPGVVHVILIG